jgi:membrane-associated phospholipid phosphatase
VGVGSGVGVGVGAGAGVGVGVGAGGGIGVFRSYYATPIELALLPWTLNFTPDNSGAGPFPLDYLINPYQNLGHPLVWTTEDWDPALRFWTLPYDEHLTEWLRSVDRTRPATLCALEFGGQPEKWLPGLVDPQSFDWISANDLGWRFLAGGTQGDANDAWDFIVAELEQLRIYMEDDRANYLLECDVQADGLAAYIIHFIRADSMRHPWTLELISVGLAIGNIAYMAYKAYYKRVRPSMLRPGLTVPFGPPGHPSFPSGHSFLAHFISLLLLEIPGIHQRLGVLPADANGLQGHVLKKPTFANLQGDGPIASPLLTVARRIAVNRERIGVHYPSDSSASRHLAAGLWDSILNRPLQNGSGPTPPIDCPTVRTVLAHAAAEWPTPFQS